MPANDGRVQWSQWQVLGKQLVVQQELSPSEVNGITIPDAARFYKPDAIVVAAGPDSRIPVGSCVYFNMASALPLQMGGEAFQVTSDDDVFMYRKESPVDANIQ